MNNNIVVFDIEIRKSIVTGALDRPLNEETEVAGWGNSHKSGLSVACLYDYLYETYRFYGEHNVNDLVNRLNNADYIVGFNHVGFDYKIIDFLSVGRLNDKEKDIDLLQCIWKEIGRVKGTSLDNITLSTLGCGKSGDGALAPLIWQEGEKDRNKIIELCDYCLQDVNLTKRLFDYILKNGHVKKDDKIVNMKSIQQLINN